MIADGPYDKLVDLLKDCLKKRNAKLGQSTGTDKNTNSVSLLPANYDSESSKAKAQKIILSAQQIENSAQHFLPYYHEGTRDKFAFGFSGFAYKEDIAEESASKILENICLRTNDSEKDARLETLHSTYINGAQNGFDGITGKSKLKEVIAFVSGCDDKVSENIIEKSLKIWHGNNALTSTGNVNGGGSAFVAEAIMTKGNQNWQRN
jgi:hypothetical protein